MKLLLIEDEKKLSESIVAYLKSENYVCEVAEDFKSAISKTESFEYDCILLDISLPDGNGLNVLRELKKNKKADGVIIISAKNSIDDKIEGLNLGADDYLPKPFHLSELSARIAAIIRRRSFNGNKLIVFEEITIDTMSKMITIHNISVDLTRTEYDLLLYLVTNKTRVVSKNAIAQHISADEADAFDSYDFIYAHLKNLRKKLLQAGCADYIKNVYGMGYKFST